MPKLTVLLVGAAVALFAIGVFLSFSYMGDIRTARERLAVSSSTIYTPCGTIEYAEQGRGYPVLVIHGSGGGFDQGLLLGDLFIGDGYRIIAPSRFGYLSSIPEKHSVVDQAENFNCLLEALNIQHVAVLAFSAGGISGLTFVHKFPGKTSALILGSAMSYSEGLTEHELNRGAAINRILSNDFIYWLFSKYAWRKMGSLFGVSADVQKTLTTEQLGKMREILQMMSPLSIRLNGVYNDQAQLMPRDFALNEITAPTLVVHAQDDTLVLPTHAMHSAEGILNAELIMIQNSGHFLISQQGMLLANIRQWLTQNGMPPL